MFEYVGDMDPAPTIAALREASHALSSGDPCEILKAAQRAQDALDAVKADAMATLDCTRDFEADGASSISTWSRNHLRLDAGEARRLARAGQTLRMLDGVDSDARSGRIRLKHVEAFTYGLKHIGPQILRDSEPWLLDVARTSEPATLRSIIRDLREAIYPDSLDKKWAEGMDREDIQINAVPDGWHLNGFLGTITGAKLKAIHDVLSAPKDKDDDRTGAQRRVAALDELCTKLLESGLPADKGVRPHISVIVEADRPAQLKGFGSIGPQLLDYLKCGADVTGILTDGALPQARVLNVGRSHRLATLKQRRAVIARQRGICAGPGCRHTHLEIHHVKPWSENGKTDLDDLIGYCVRCHHLHHRGLLQIKATDVPGAYEVHGRDPRPGREAYKRRLAAYRETNEIRRIAHEIRTRRERREPVPLRT